MPTSRRQFLLASGIAAALSSSMTRLLAQGASDDVILKAMLDEIARFQQLHVAGGGGDDVPYFLSYTIDDNEVLSVSASFGAVTSKSQQRFRYPGVEVRVGSYDFDNTGHVFSGYYNGSRYDTEPLPLDDSYLSLREGLWLGTDYAFKAAVESIARKRASLTNAAAPAEKLPDYSKAQPVQSLAKINRPKIDLTPWTARVTKLSAIFNSYPEVLASGVDFRFHLDTTYYVNTEGTQLRYGGDIGWLQARAEGQAADGMIVRETLGLTALDVNQFPSDAEMERTVKAVAGHIQSLVKAPVGESYVGPALFEPEAAAQLLAQLLGDNLRIPRKPVTDPGRPMNLIASEFDGRMGARVVPEWITVVDDPTQTRWQGKPLAGYYPFDFEGVAPQPVTVIDKGFLRRFLSTRQPIRNLPASNGHARFPAGFGTRSAAIGNLFFNATQTTPLADLKARLIELCRERDKPYGLLLRKLDFPFSGNNPELQALQTVSAQSGGSVRPVSPPVLAYRVYADGREELVRGLRFKGLSSRSLRDILAASAETTAFHYINTGAPLARAGVSGFIAGTSVIAPGLLFDEVEVDRIQEPLEKPPVVPPPVRGTP